MHIHTPLGRTYGQVDECNGNSMWNVFPHIGIHIQQVYNARPHPQEEEDNRNGE